MMENSLSKKWKFEEGHEEIKRVGGRWGGMYIDYENFDVGKWECVICGYSSPVEQKTHEHISEDHDVREKMENLAEEMGFNDDSRIDRFRKVMNTMDKVDWAHKLTDARKDRPVEEEPEYTPEPGLDAAPGY